MKCEILDTNLDFTERQIREKEFYEQYVSSFDLTREVDFSPIMGKEMRPWNSYWMVYHLAQLFGTPGARLLDFGSGPGDNALRFSELGFSVDGFDICESNVKVAQELFKRYGRSKLGNFQVSAAENLPYPDRYFDFVAGIDILHHVDIRKALLECYRVMKDNGIAVFREPVEVPVLDRIRNNWPLNILAPRKASLERHITEDERKLNEADLEIIRLIFPRSTTHYYLLLARFDKFFRKWSDPSPSLLEKIDYVLLKYFPVLRSFGGARIIVLRKS